MRDRPVRTVPHLRIGRGAGRMGSTRQTSVRPRGPWSGEPVPFPSPPGRGAVSIRPISGAPQQARNSGSRQKLPSQRSAPGL